MATKNNKVITLECLNEYRNKSSLETVTSKLPVITTIPSGSYIIVSTSNGLKKFKIDDMVLLTESS